MVISDCLECNTCNNARSIARSPPTNSEFDSLRATAGVRYGSRCDLPGQLSSRPIRSEFIGPEDLSNSVTERKSSNAAGSFDVRVNDLKRTLVEGAVVDAAGDFEVAAATLGLSAR